LKGSVILDKAAILWQSKSFRQLGTGQTNSQNL